MAEITLTATPGRATGTRNSRRLRAQAKVPAVVYGLGRDAVPVTVDWRELRAALITDAGINALIDLTVEGEDEAQLSIIKDMQRDPITHTVDHIDFLMIRRDQELAIDVPVVLLGTADEVENNQGLVEQAITLLTVNALPESIPDQLTYDISEMEIGDTVTVSDLALPSGVTTDVEGDEVVASAQVSRAAIEAEAEAAALEAAAAAEEGAVGEGDGEGAGGDSTDAGGDED